MEQTIEGQWQMLGDQLGGCAETQMRGDGGLEWSGSSGGTRRYRSWSTENHTVDGRWSRMTPRFWPVHLEEWSCHLLKWGRLQEQDVGARGNIHLGNPYGTLVPAGFLGNEGPLAKPGSNTGSISWYLYPQK